MMEVTAERVAVNIMFVVTIAGVMMTKCLIMTADIVMRMPKTRSLRKCTNSLTRLTAKTAK